MYQILGSIGGRKRILIAEVATAGEALTKFREAQTGYTEIVVLTSEGNQISGYELSKRYQADEAKRYA